MKKLLIMIGLIESVYGNEINVSSWDSLIGYCSNATDITETICGNSVTFGNVYTLKEDNTTYNWNINSDSPNNIPNATKFVIPNGITLNLKGSGSNPCFYLGNNTVIKVNGILSQTVHLLGPNEKGEESTYTNAYIIVNGTFNNLLGNQEFSVKTGAEYSKLYILGSGTINNPHTRIMAAGENSEIIFLGNLTINNSGAIYTSNSNTSIKFLIKNPVNNSGFIYTDGENSSIIISKDTKIINKGGALYTVTDNNPTSLILNGTIAFEKGEGSEGEYPVFSTTNNNYTSFIISGEGSIDLSGLINANMQDGEAWLSRFENGGINIPKESFSSSTPFTGIIKLPYNTTCTNLDLSDATEATILVPVLNHEEIILDANKITKGKTIMKLTAEEFSKLNIKLPGDYDSYDTYNIYQNIPLTIPNILNLFPSYNIASNYIVTDELDETIYEINEGEDITVNFGIKGRTPLDLRGKGKITFKGDNSEYKIPRPMIKFEGEKSVFPRDAIYDHVEFAEGSVIPKDTIIVAKNPQNLSNVTVEGHLILE